MDKDESSGLLRDNGSSLMESSDEMTIFKRRDKLSFLLKLGYGCGESSLYVTGLIQGFFLNTFLLEVADLDPYTSGTVLLFVKLWDAFIDPIVGNLSDTTRTKWGRRRPWLFFSAIPYGVLYASLWVVPNTSSEGKLVYYAFMLILYNTVHTCYGIPFVSLTPDLTPNYDERTSLAMYRFLFAIPSGVVASFIHSTLVEFFKKETSKGENYQEGYLVSAVIFGMAVMIPPLITFVVTDGKEMEPPKEETSEHSLKKFFYGVKDVFSNFGFLCVLFVYIFSWFTIQFVQNNLFLYVKYVLKLEDEFNYILLCIQGTAALALFIWAKISNKYGKKLTYFVGMSFWIVVEVLLFFLQEGDKVFMYILSCLAGIGVAAAFLIPWSMIPDVIELDQLDSGKRREGIFYAWFLLLQKTGVAFGLAFSSYALGFAGYIDPNEQASEGQEEDYQPDSVKLALRIMIGPLAAVLLLISFIPAYFYPITKKRHQEIRLMIEQRDKQNSSS